MKKLSKVQRKKVAGVSRVDRALVRRSVDTGKGDFSPDKLRVLFTANQIKKRVGELARQMNRDFKGRTIHAVGILENCFLFMSDLVRQLKCTVICHFLKAEMTDSMAGAVAVRQIVFTPKVDVTGKDVLLIDGVLQSGVTLDHLLRLMVGQGASSIRTALLVQKVEDLKVDVATDYVGFKTKAKFVVGYGLGYQDRYRNLPYLATRK